MKMYLSSYNFGNKPEELVKLLCEIPKAAVIMNAGDIFGDEKRPQYFEAQVRELQKLGITSEELDLRKYFGKPEELSEKLKTYDLVWITGGNSFVLRRAMRQSGFDISIVPLVEQNRIVYAGYSAGAVVATYDLHGIELVDDPNEVPDGYLPTIVWEGLKFVRKSIAPHYRSNHPESEAINRVVEYFIDNDIDYLTLSDGEVLLVQDSVITKIV